MKILLGDFNAYVGERNFQNDIGIENLLQDGNDKVLESTSRQ